MKNALIVAVVGGFLPQFELNNARILMDLGYRVHYAANFDNPVYALDRKALEHEGIILHHIPIEKSPAKLINGFRACRAIKRIIKAQKISLIHCHNPMGGVWTRLAAWPKPTGLQLLYTAHGFHFYKGAPFINRILYYPVERVLATLTDGLITINDEDYLNAQTFFKGGCGKAYKIPSVGVNGKRFFPVKDKIEALKAKENFEIPPKGFHIVSAGELNSNKNHATLIRAIGKINKKDIYCSICGEGSLKGNLQTLINELGLESRVRLLGYREDMENVLKSADVFVFPSIREGLGMAAVEALFTGIPVICLDNRGSREYARNEVNALVLGENTSKAFADAIDRVHTDRELLKRMAGNARVSVQNFSIENVGRIMKEIYLDSGKRA